MKAGSGQEEEERKMKKRNSVAETGRDNDACNHSAALQKRRIEDAEDCAPQGEACLVETLNTLSLLI